ncbi:MAG: MurR/RpiR family transcriptional regulator [Pseudomonadota bacterium]
MLASAEAVTEALAEGFAGFPVQLQRAARFILDNPREVGVHSMRALAAKAEVHPNTLVRLAQAIGLEGYEALRERFRDFMVAGGMGGFGERADFLQAMARDGGTGAVLAGMAAATTANLQAAWARQDPGEVEAVADLVRSAPRVFVLGMGSAYALAYQFWYVARMAFDTVTPIPRHGSAPIDDLARVGAGDVVIALTFQPYRAETMEAVRHARAAGATVVGISDSATAPLASLSDHFLSAPTHTPQVFQSQAAVTALLEGLVGVAIARAGPETAAAVESFHRRRMDAGLYEEPAALARLG